MKSILIAPDFYMEACTHEGRRLKEKLIESGYNVEIADIGKSIYETDDKVEEKYIETEPDLIVSFGLGCLMVGRLCNTHRLMINPDFSLSELAKEKMNEYKKVLDYPEMENGSAYLFGYHDSSQAYEQSLMLENPDNCLKGEGKILGIFAENFADEKSTKAYMERYGAYKVIPDLDTTLNSSLDMIVKEINEFS